MKLLRILGALALIITLHCHSYAQAVSAVEERYFLAAFLNDHKIGYGVNERSVENDIVTTTESIFLDLQRLGNPMRITIDYAYRETRDGEPLGFDYKQVLGPMSMTTHGELKEGTLEVTINTAGIEQKRSIAWQSAALFPEGMRLKQLEDGIKVGQAITLTTFDPGTLQFMDMTVKIGPKEKVDILGRQLELYRADAAIAMQNGQTMPMVSYVDDELSPYKMHYSVGGIEIDLLVCEEHIAKSPSDNIDFLTDLSVVKVPEPITNINDRDKLGYQLRINNDAFAFIETAAQSVTQLDDGSWHVWVRVQALENDEPYPATYDDPDVTRFLAPTRYVQNDDPNIIQLAKEITNGAATTGQVAQRIQSFVHDYIDHKHYGIGYATARDVYLTKQGDCTEHAVFAAALGKAAGIPSRVVLGLLYSSNFMNRKNAFVGHAWTQLYLDGQWHDIDGTTYYPRGFTVGHITLDTGNGNPEDYFKMIQSLNAITVEKVLEPATP